jgi:hypothetical protein
MTQDTSSNTMVRYESDKVFIEVFHGERDYEVGLNFGRTGKNEHFSFGLFCKLMKLEPVASIEMISDDKLRVEEFIAILARTLEEDASKIINGDNEIFERMKTVRWWDFNPEALGKNS